jgi:hypothetical protein
VVDHRLQLVLAKIERGECNRKPEPPWAGAAGVHIHHSVHCSDAGPMRVPVDDDGEIARKFVRAQVIDVVNNVKRSLRKPDRKLFRVMPCPVARMTFPLIALTGAILPSAEMMSGLPISPAWMMWETPARRTATSGRSSPWVSEIIPIFIIPNGLLRGAARITSDFGA